jgi:primosomal protein N' (replication factor Y)
VDESASVADTPPLCALVAVHRPGGEAYSYAVPPALVGSLTAGDAVEVPYGRQLVGGFVLAVGLPPPVDVTLKPISRRRDDLRLPAHLLELIRWGAGYYRCHLGTFLAGAVPAPVREGGHIAVERLLSPVAGFDASVLTPTQRRAWEQLAAAAPATAAAHARTAEVSAGVIAKLVAAGALHEDIREVGRESLFAPRIERHPLTDEQRTAITAIKGGGAQTWLLHGVTGSGKTLVYQELAEAVITAGRQVLVLLPEIALTPQLAARFRGRFPRLAVWHSDFSDSERMAQWREVSAGRVDLVIGTRSALFAPLPDIGLIVVDEEHDGSFKQDRDPRYHARDLAVVYAKQLGVPLVLGTATPSVETYRNAKDGRYRVVSLRQRPAGGCLPTATIIDMAAECRRQGRRAVLAKELVEGLAGVRARGEQAIVLLNRRGWSPLVECLSCGHTMRCSACAVGLTYHRHDGCVRCHYCGHSEALPQRCPACGKPDLATRGMGSEQLESRLRDDVPGLRTLRLDADTVAARAGHERILAAFAAGEADCLVGTQMVAKGLDFPRVTLVGVVQADRGLNIPDFRAAERSFQLLAQVAGRAGRGERPGQVLVQAYDTEHPALTCALGQRLRSFYERELELRREYGYPPYAGLVRVLWSGPETDAVQVAALDGVERLRAAAGHDAVVLGPAPATLALLKNQVRWQALVKAPSRGAVQTILDRLAANGWLPRPRNLHVAVDVDPLQTS